MLFLVKHFSSESGKEKWIVVNTDATYSENIEVSGTVNLILCDGRTLTAKDGIYIQDGSSLIIWGQENDSGKINANTKNDKAA